MHQFIRWSLAIQVLWGFPFAHATDWFACEQKANPEGIFSSLVERGAVERTELRLSAAARAQMAALQAEPGSLVPQTERVARFVATNLPHFSGSTALYPASGFDAATPFLILPSLRRVIALDAHPFLGPRLADVPLEILPHQAESPGEGAVDVWRIDRMGNMAPAILGRLAQSFPGFRLREVVAYSGANDRHHGRVLFDQGPGTSLREYNHVHISEIFSENFAHPPQRAELNPSPQREWLRQILFNNSFEAILSRGSMHFLRTAMGGSLMRELQRNQGVLIDGDGDRRWFHPDYLPERGPRARIISAPISGFGRDPDLSIVDYSPALMIRLE